MIVELQLLLLLVLLGCSAFFSGSETAITAASRARIYALASQGDRRAGRVEKLHHQMERVIATILLGNTFVNNFAASITALIFASYFGTSGAMVVVASISITAVIFIFSEVLPKTYAVNNAERVAIALAPVLAPIVKITYPVTHVTQIIINSVLGLFGVKVEREPGAEESIEELRGAIDLHSESAEEIREAGAMLHSILDLDEVPVSDTRTSAGAMGSVRLYCPDQSHNRTRRYCAGLVVPGDAASFFEGKMNGLLVRVGADLSGGGGSWNGPINGVTGEFVYVAIPESRPVHPGLEKPYSALSPVLDRFGISLPEHLRGLHMHLDPDFAYLTYGDQGERARQLRASLNPGDFVVFYAGLADVRGDARLTYALIGLFVVDSIVRAVEVRTEQRDCNAHSRRILAPDAQDIIVRARPGVSGRFLHCIPIGEYRDRSYRVRRDTLADWGGLSVNDGYLQRSARLPRFLDAQRFLQWLERQGVTVIQNNN